MGLEGPVRPLGRGPAYGSPEQEGSQEPLEQLSRLQAAEIDTQLLGEQLPVAFQQAPQVVGAQHSLFAY